MKKVSVIVLVYASEPYIATALNSVLAQTYKNFEIIIVDDGSPDRSIEICQQFTDPRIQIIRQENRGAPAARNTGIRHAQGEYIAFLDGDDIWLPEKLEKQVEHLKHHPQVGVSFSRSAFIDQQGNFLGTYQMPQLQGITLAYLLRCNPIGNGSAAVVRREVFSQIQFPSNLFGTAENCYFDEQLRQTGGDLDFWLRVVIQTKWQIEGLPEALTLYRINPTGISANMLKRLEYAGKEIEKIGDYAPELRVEWQGAAKAYYLRYLARSAVRFQQGAVAINLVHQGLMTHWRMIIEEPRSTLTTLVAAYLLYLLPQRFYGWIDTVATTIVGARQKRHIIQESKQLACHQNLLSKQNESLPPPAFASED